MLNYNELPQDSFIRQKLSENLKNYMNFTKNINELNHKIMVLYNEVNY